MIFHGGRGWDKNKEIGGGRGGRVPPTFQRVGDIISIVPPTIQ